MMSDRKFKFNHDFKYSQTDRNLNVKNKSINPPPINKINLKRFNILNNLK